MWSWEWEGLLYLTRILEVPETEREDKYNIWRDMLECQQDGELEDANTHLPDKKARINKQLKTQENSSGRILDDRVAAKRPVELKN